MATANYRTMRNFDLFVFCPDEYDEFIYDDFQMDIEPDIEQLNEGLLFHKVSLKSGYYDGVQLYIDCEHELDLYNDYDDDECFYYFDMNKEDSYEAFFREIEYLKKELLKIAKNHGMNHLRCAGIFSNGEAIYYEVQEAAEQSEMDSESNVA